MADAGGGDHRDETGWGGSLRKVTHVFIIKVHSKSEEKKWASYGAEVFYPKLKPRPFMYFLVSFFYECKALGYRPPSCRNIIFKLRLPSNYLSSGHTSTSLPPYANLIYVKLYIYRHTNHYLYFESLPNPNPLA